MTETKCIFDTVGTAEPPSGLTLRTLQREPRIYSVDNFLSDEECAHVIRLAQADMEPSITVDLATGADVVAHHRSSTSAWVQRGCDDTVAAIEERIAAVINLPATYGGNFNVLRYQIGQAYGPHYDYFDPAIPGLASTLAERGQRFLTMLLYLADVDEGGETIFPKVDFAYKPVKRSGLIFYNVLPDGKIDPLSYHGSAPVIKGEKWVATKWILEQPV